MFGLASQLIQLWIGLVTRRVLPIRGRHFRLETFSVSKATEFKIQLDDNFPKSTPGVANLRDALIDSQGGEL